MAGRRLVPKSLVDDWHVMLSKALRQALDGQRANLVSSMRMAGRIPPAVLVAAGPPRKGQPKYASFDAWDDASWSDQVDTYVAPVASHIAQAAETAAKAALPAALVWGIASNAQAMADRITQSAVDSGASIGDRMNVAASLGDGSDQAMADVMDTSGDILDNVVGSLASITAESASMDARSYVATLAGNIYTGATVSWNDVGDDHVRPGHDEVEDVGLNEPFLVNGEYLMAPGDDQGSPENIEGCRCSTETTGLPEGEEDTQNEGYQ